MPLIHSESPRSLTENEIKTLNSLLHLKHWRKINKILNANNEKSNAVTAQMAYDFLHNSENIAPCGKKKVFVGFSVGYRFCGKTSKCICAKQAVSLSVSSTKLSRSADENKRINDIRTSTVQKKYGVDNVFQIDFIKKYIKDNGFAYKKEVQEKRKITNIEKYGNENPAANAVVRSRISETCKNKFGFDNPFLNPEVQKKCNQTLFDKYGVYTPMHSEIIKNKVIETNLKKYGFDNVSKNPEIIQKIKDSIHDTWRDQVFDRFSDDYLLIGNYNGAKNINLFKCKKCNGEFESSLINGGNPRCKKCVPIGSGLEENFANFIKTIEPNIICNDRKIIKPYELDIVIPDKKIAIEICGLYWHSEDKLGKYYHLNKLKMCQNAEYRLITIFEDELLCNKNIVESRLRHITGNTLFHNYARKCHVNFIDSKQANEFLNEYHIQGSVKSPINFGLFFNEEIVAIMTFGRPRFGSASNGYELTRFCSKNFVVGGASKLLKHFINFYNPSQIISYADKRWSNGKLYENLGFQKISETLPNYWYIRGKKRYNRLNFTKQKLVNEGFDKNMTEFQIMKERGFLRIYDCGSIKYVYNLKDE